MTSIEKKLRQKGYNHDKDFPREALERELSQPPAVERHISKHSNRCKKSKDGRHDWELEKELTYSWSKNTSYLYKCAGCGKKLFKSRKLKQIAV